MGLFKSPGCCLHPFESGFLKCRVWDQARLVAVASSRKDLTVDRFSKVFSAPFDNRCELVIEWSAGISWHAGGLHARRKCPLRKSRCLNRFTTPIKRNPRFAKPIEVAT